MLDAKQIRRTMVLAGALAACAAPAASARPAGEYSYAKPSADAAQTRVAPGLGEAAARREARTAQQWQAANRVSVAAIPEPEGNGFSWPSAAIGASVPLTIVLFGVAGHALVTHRRGGAGGGIAPQAPTGA